MNKPARRVGCSILALLCGLTAGTPGSSAAPSPSSSPSSAASGSPSGSSSSNEPVAITVASIDPLVPPATSANTTVTVTLTVTNTSSSTFGQLSLSAMREAPVISRSRLDDELMHPSRSSSLLSPLPSEPVTGGLDAHQTRALTYTFQTSTTDTHGVACFCQPGVYPLDISLQTASSSSASSSSSNGSRREVGWTQTYLPYVADGDSATVGWVWPLIDEPHRGLDPDVFLNDKLAAEVAVGGRLDRALAVLEEVGAAAKMSVVIDPELIDELDAMTHGYRVAAGANATPDETPDATVAGTGGPAATAWLTRLRTFLATIPTADVALTPYADPDIDAATAAGLPWTTTLPAEMRTSVDTDLGARYTSAFAWPPGETVSSAALKQLIAGGTSSVLVDDATLPANDVGSDTASGMPGLSTLPGYGAATAVVIGRALNKRAANAMTSSGAADASALIAELAMQASSEDNSYLVFAPDRRVDVDPTIAARVIAATTGSSWLTAVSPATAAATITPVPHRALATQPTGAIPSGLIAHAVAAQQFVTGFSSSVGTTEAAALFHAFPAARQRLESSAWRTDPRGPQILVRCSAILRRTHDLIPDFRCPNWDALLRFGRF